MTASRRHALTAIVLCLAGGVAAATALTHGATGSGAGDLAALSADGRPVEATAREESELQAVGATGAELLGARDGRTFYRLARPDGTVCYSVNATEIRDHLGGVACPPVGGFPSPEAPVLDLSVFESTSHTSRSVTLVRAQGFAADGVAQVALLGPGGTTTRRVRVTGNVYALDVPLGASVVGLVAYDRHGRELFRNP